MKSLLLKALILFCIVFYFSGCNNSDGQKIVGVGNGTGNNPPAVPSNPIPTNNATGTSNIVILSWTCTDPDAGDTVKYDVYLDQVSPPTTKVVSDYLPTTYGFGVVDHNLALYWKVVAHDLKGASTSSPVWTFRTAP